jgi:3-oxoacyl-[acyl-carrier protein] reductase
MGSLTGKKVFITGAEQGIGKETARKLIEAGCDIYIHYFSGEDGPRELITMAQQRGARRLRLCGFDQ